MQFSINLATRTYVDQRLVTRSCLLLLGVGIVLLAWNGFRLVTNLGEGARLTAEAAQLQEKLGSRPGGVSKSDYDRQLASIGFYNGIIERRSFNWLAVLDRLERVTPEGVALSSVAPALKDGTLKIDGRAKAFAGVRTFIEKLEDSGLYRDVLLQAHRDVSLGEKTRGVEFSLSCRMVTP